MCDWPLTAGPNLCCSDLTARYAQLSLPDGARHSMVSREWNFRHLQSGLGLIPTGHPDPSCSTTQSPSIGDGSGRVKIFRAESLEPSHGIEITIEQSTGGSRYTCIDVVYNVTRPPCLFPQLPLYTHLDTRYERHVCFVLFRPTRCE